MEQISIDLADDMTLGALRALARAMGKRLSISLEEARSTAFARAPEPPAPAEAPVPPLGAEGPAPPAAPRRKLSPEGRAALARNLAKARAARSARAKAAREAMAATPAKVATRVTRREKR